MNESDESPLSNDRDNKDIDDKFDLPASTESEFHTDDDPPDVDSLNGFRSGWPALKLSLVRSALDRVPYRYRPALYYESIYNIGVGAFVSLFLLSTVVLKTVLDGNERHLALFAALFGGSSLLSPLVSYVGRKVNMKLLVVLPNLLVAVFLLTTAMPGAGATWFAIVVGLAFVVRVFPRVAEMNMYRVLYPPTHRGTAVGWVKAIAAVSGLSVTLVGYWWFAFRPQWYWALYALVALILVVATASYQRIPFARKNVFVKTDSITPYRAFRDGLRIFIADRRFLYYQFGFALAGTANHMVHAFIPEVLKEHLHADYATIGLIGAVLPAVLITASAPFWGRFLDRVNPMIGRATFNTLQGLSFLCHAYGGLTMQIWPFFIGATLHAISNGGGTINWLTGSLYFARSERISLYNAVHVGLTGLRGLLAPLLGLYLISKSGLGLGPNIFWVSATLSLLGAACMLHQGLTDPGPREETAKAPTEKTRPQPAVAKL